MPSACVIDIGGTHFRCGAYEQGSYRFLAKSETPNYEQFPPPRHAPVEIKERLVERIVSYYQETRLHVDPLPILAIGFPGPVTASGMVQQSSVIFNQRLEKPWDLRRDLWPRFPDKSRVPEHIWITNDMTASAWRYSGRGYDPFCLITVSSGIGNKVFANGQVMIGEDGFAGEIGHFATKLGNYNIPCSCGSGMNHIGMVSSGRGIEHFARAFGRRGNKYYAGFRKSELGRKTNFNAALLEGKNEWIAQAADTGDRFARTVIDFCTRPLARAICMLSLALYIRKFVLIGGFALHCEYYRASLIRNALNEGVYNFTEDQIREMIILGDRDDNHAPIGLGIMIEGNQFQKQFP